MWPFRSVKPMFPAVVELKRYALEHYPEDWAAISGMTVAGGVRALGKMHGVHIPPNASFEGSCRRVRDAMENRP